MTPAPLSPCACLTAPPVTGTVLYFTHPLLHLFYISPSLSCIYPSQKSLFALIYKKFLNAFLGVLACQHFWATASSQAHLFIPFSASQDPVQISPHRIRHTPLFSICPSADVAVHVSKLCPSFLRGFVATIRFHNSFTLLTSPLMLFS